MQSLLPCGIDLSSVFGYAHFFDLNAIFVSFETVPAAVTSEFILASFWISFQIICKKTDVKWASCPSSLNGFSLYGAAGQPVEMRI